MKWTTPKCNVIHTTIEFRRIIQLIAKATGEITKGQIEGLIIAIHKREKNNEQGTSNARN